MRTVKVRILPPQPIFSSEMILTSVGCFSCFAPPDSNKITCRRNVPQFHLRFRGGGASCHGSGPGQLLDALLIPSPRDSHQKAQTTPNCQRNPFIPGEVPWNERHHFDEDHQRCNQESKEGGGAPSQ